jgi:hypothetical protein
MACSASPEPTTEQAGAANSGGRGETGYTTAGFLVQRPGTDSIDFDCTAQSPSPNCVRNDGAANAPHCGAALVSPFFALTAAHCLDLHPDSPLDTGQVRYESVLVHDAPPLAVGVGNFSERNIVPAHYVIVHPDYVPSNRDRPALNDVALVKILTPEGAVTATLNDASNEVRPGGCDFRFVGYGYHWTRTQWTLSERRSHTACSLSFDQVQAFGNRYGSEVPIAPGNLAFQGHDGNSCIADSGSAVFVDGTNDLVGILSAMISAPDPEGDVPVCPAIESSIASVQSVYQQRHFIGAVTNTCTHKATVQSCLNALGISRQLHKTPSPVWLGPPFPKPRW